ncbi:MAG: bifunctional glycosyltransferase family 2/GtrA family protein [Bacilli bacterium]|nr:bifunctional glycosyltransferase family 2/GtrA family protein [Bacilli bacterium]
MRVALIPSYEPDLVLLDVVKELLSNNFNVVVVNDGSKPEYNVVFGQLPEEVHYLSYEQNGGKGHALKHGLKYIKDNFDQCTVVTLDSDGQHKVSDAIRICEECEKHEQYSLILGSRQFDKKAPRKSRFGNFMARLSFLISTHHKIYDTQTGLRAFNSNLLDIMINVKGERYEYEMNVLLEVIRESIPIIEVKIETIYFNNNAGTHYNPFKDTMKIFIEVLKFSASSMIGFGVDYGMFALLSLIPNPWEYWLVARNVIARIVSASVNFTINYKIVFKSKQNIFKAIIEYTLLALFILGCNSLFLWLLVKNAGMNEYLAKILVEGTMFIVSWIIQRLFVFRRRQKK